MRPRAPKEAFLTLDFKPGAAFQVDWADFGFALPGCPRRVSGFVMVACYSRYLYLEFTLSQAMGTFLRCMERGLAFFGGVATADIFDNMKTVVLSHTPYATVFNHRFVEYARARGFAVVACNVRKGNEKDLVERPIGFVRVRFWPGRRFTDLLDLNTQALRWRDDIANHRVHEVTGKVPALVFRHEEQRHLKPIPATPFDVDDVETNTVTKSFRVTIDRNRYSVPWRLVSQSVLVRATDDGGHLPRTQTGRRAPTLVGRGRGHRASVASRRSAPAQTTRRGRCPAAGPVLDALSLRAPDLSLYDQLVPQPMTRDPGAPPTFDEDDHETR